MNMRCDFFCHIVDNYGDAGVMWRLARAWLENETAQRIRFCCDDVALIERMGGTQLAQYVQEARVQLVPWQAQDSHLSAVEYTDTHIVIAGFGVRLARRYIDQMAAVPPVLQPVWINLEYLSAEDWVQDCHALPSPDPQTGFVQWVFFPGFTARTGGLLAHPAPAAYAADAQACLVFTYPSPCLIPLVQACLRAQYRPAIAHGAGAHDLQAQLKSSAVVDAATLQWLPFIDQPSFDAQLNQSAWAVVRGEDSFVRALMSAKPFLWHIYPQDDGVHLTKLRAFLQHYCVGWPQDLALLHLELSLALNTPDAGRFSTLIDPWLAALPQLQQQARAFAQDLAQRSNLQDGLAGFIKNQLKSKA